MPRWSRTPRWRKSRATRRPFGPRRRTPSRPKTKWPGRSGFPPANVRVITPFLGGGFGGKTFNQQAVEAATLAKAVGKPVQVAWSRAEEFFFDTFRPAAIVKIKLGRRRRGPDRALGLSRLFRRRARGEAVLRHPEPQHASRTAAAFAASPARIPSPPAHGAGPAPTPTPTPANRRST